MKTILFCLIFILSGAQAALSPQYWEQPTHIRNLIFEGWSGSYIESTYVGALGTVRFDFCQRTSTSVDKQCERLHRPLVLIRDLGFYQPHLLKGLKELRAELAKELDEGFFSRLLGGSEGDRNIEALDQIVREIEAESLAKWLLNTDDPRPMPTVSSLSVSSRVAEVFQYVFELPTPKTAPDSLRISQANY